MRLRLWAPDILGVTWVATAALVVLLPALVHGTSLGPFNLLGVSGLSKVPGSSAHNGQMLDQIQAFIPWTTLAWRQVHAGHLPLWNPYSLLGLPLAFNWQSAPFSVPALVGYLVPLRLAYTTQVFVTMLIAGTGVYVLGRMLRLRVLGCVMAATTFELSGSFFGWLGWSVAGVMCWAGWLFAAALLVARGERRMRAVVFLSVVVACAIYAGQPETLVLLFLALIVWIATLLGRRATRSGGGGPVLRPILDTAVGAIAGALLAAPLLFPGIELLSTSTRRGQSGGPALPLHDLAHFVLQGFDGLPVAGSTPITGKNWYSETAAFMGVIALVLAIVAVAFRRRRPETVAFAVVVVAMGGLVFIDPLVLFLNGLPVVKGLEWHRALVPLTFAVAVLAGMGLDALIRSRREGSEWSWTALCFVGAALVLVALWVFGRGNLPSAQSATRARSFLWPAIETAVGLTVVAAFSWHRRRRPSGSGARESTGARRWAAVSLLTCETVVLVVAGAPLWSSSPTYLTPTPAEVAFTRAVGSSVVGFGTRSCSIYSALGMVPDVNIAYGVRELAAYDPATPNAYPQSWAAATGHSEAGRRLGFCPAVPTAAVARRFGVEYLLEPSRYPGPPGAVFDETIGGEDLYRVPGAAVATLTPLTSTGSLPGADARGTAVPATYPDPSTWRLVTGSKRAEVLRVRLTDVPGWHGSIDGRPLELHRFSGVMLQAVIPPGHHTVVVRYWPTAFTVGIVLAVLSAVGLACPLVVSGIRRRQRIPRTPKGAASD